MDRPSYFYPDTIWHNAGDGSNVVVWLPAFGDSGTMTARPYIQKLNQQGWSVLVVNHHQSGFRMNDTVYEVLQILALAKRQRILLVGASFGAQILAEVLRQCGLHFHQVDRRELFSVICVCGVSSGQDTLKPIGWAKHIHGPIVGTVLKLGQAAQITFGGESPYDEDDDEVVASIKPHQQFRKWHFSARALAEQTHAMATTAPIRKGEFAGIPALILTTKGEDHLLKPVAPLQLGRAFSPSRLRYIEESIHCDLTELPSQYGPEIWDFAEMVINTEARSR